jgi:hypothetical protein
MPSDCDHSNHSRAGAGGGSSHDLMVGSPNLKGSAALDVYKYLLVGPSLAFPCLAFPLTLADVLMIIGVAYGS